MNTPNGANTSVFIYGMMLAGKSSVGRKVAEILHLQFEDLDDHVVEYLKKEGFDGIGDFIEKKTEELGTSEGAWDAFGEIENICLKDLLENGERKVIASGGRTMFSEQNRQLISETQNLITFYLEISQEEQVARAQKLDQTELEHRPALRGDLEGFFSKMQEDRAEIYSSHQNKVPIPVDGKTIDKIVEKIIARAA